MRQREEELMRNETKYSIAKPWQAEPGLTKTLIEDLIEDTDLQGVM